MRDYPFDRVISEQFRCNNKWCLIFNHWLNPFGNWKEPIPCPEHNYKAALESWMPMMLWWNLRNPLNNFVSHWIGIIPIGPRYCWIRPEMNGWVFIHKDISNWSFWKKHHRITLPYYRNDNVFSKFTFYIGWTSNGNFGFAFRSNKS